MREGRWEFSEWKDVYGYTVYYCSFPTKKPWKCKDFGNGGHHCRQASALGAYDGSTAEGSSTRYPRSSSPAQNSTQSSYYAQPSR